jgi:hypothetical protein
VYAAVAAVLGIRALLQLRAEAVNVKPSHGKFCDAVDVRLGRSRVAAVIPNQGVLRYLVEFVSLVESGVVYSGYDRVIPQAKAQTAYPHL